MGFAVFSSWVMKVVDVWMFYESPIIQARLTARGRPIPKGCARLLKAMCQSIIVSVGSVCATFLLVCVALRPMVHTQPTPVGITIVITFSIAKHLYMHFVLCPMCVSWKANLATTDHALFFNSYLATFGTQLLASALRSVEAISAVSVTTSIVEVGLTALQVYRRHVGAARTEKRLSIFSASTMSSRSTGGTGQLFSSVLAAATPQEHVEEQRVAEVAREGLALRRRNLSTEIILLLNELSVDIYCSVGAVTLSLAFQRSTVVTQLRSEITLKQFPIFVTIQCVPELIESWLVITYLRRIGVDFSALGLYILANPRVVLSKVSTFLAVLCFTLLCAVDRQ